MYPVKADFKGISLSTYIRARSGRFDENETATPT
jgi:hypothetical protein